MINIRSILYSLCMVGELLVFMYIYITGGHGALALREIQKSSAEMQTSCNKLEQEIEVIKQSMNQWEKYPFYTEQRARQQLYMGRPEEVWYWYGG